VAGGLFPPSVAQLSNFQLAPSRKTQYPTHSSIRLRPLLQR
jgi:hypothetical protein